MDPLADEYPSLSPYNYCGGNPVMLVDPDGMEIRINGDWAQDLVTMFNSFITYGEISINNGLLNYNKKENFDENKLGLFENLIKSAIDDPNQTIEINTVYKDDNILIDGDERTGGENKVDVYDLNLLEGEELKIFQKAFIAHFIQERMEGGAFDISHGDGISVETQILQQQYPDILPRSNNLFFENLRYMDYDYPNGDVDRFVEYFPYGTSDNSLTPISLWCVYYDPSGGVKVGGVDEFYVGRVKK